MFSTHNPAEAQRYAQRLIVLADGALLFDGTPGKLLAASGRDAAGSLEDALLELQQGSRGS